MTTLYRHIGQVLTKLGLQADDVYYDQNYVYGEVISVKGIKMEGWDLYQLYDFVLDRNLDNYSFEEIFTLFQLEKGKK
jgi:hypothetical protein